MRFIGQNYIMQQLRFMLPVLYSNQSMGENFLLQGPSGFGKTTMAVGICNYLSGNSFEIYNYDKIPFRFYKRVVFIDEIHKMNDPEFLFPIMDGKKHVLVLATNHDSVLPEALVNRCIQFIFTDYSEEELIIICRDFSKLPISEANLLKIINAGNNNPRIIKSIITRMEMYFVGNSSEDPRTTNYDEILTRVFDINDGIDTVSKRYLEILEDVGGICSLSMLKSLLHVDENTLKQIVEPVLLKKGKIKITPKGRILLQ